MNAFVKATSVPSLNTVPFGMESTEPLASNKQGSWPLAGRFRKAFLCLKARGFNPPDRGTSFFDRHKILSDFFFKDNLRQ